MSTVQNNEPNEHKLQLQADRGRHLLSGLLYPAIIADAAFVGAFELALMAVIPSIKTDDDLTSVTSMVRSCSEWASIILVVLAVVTGAQVWRTRKIEDKLVSIRSNHAEAIEPPKTKEIP